MKMMDTYHENMTLRIPAKEFRWHHDMPEDQTLVENLTIVKGGSDPREVYVRQARIVGEENIELTNVHGKIPWSTAQTWRKWDKYEDIQLFLERMWG